MYDRQEKIERTNIYGVGWKVKEQLSLIRKTPSKFFLVRKNLIGQRRAYKTKMDQS